MGCRYIYTSKTHLSRESFNKFGANRIEYIHIYQKKCIEYVHRQSCIWSDSTIKICLPKNKNYTEKKTHKDRDKWYIYIFFGLNVILWSIWVSFHAFQLILIHNIYLMLVKYYFNNTENRS